MEKSWMSTSRTKKQYINGVEAFIKFVVHNLQKMRNIDPRGDKQQLLIPCSYTTCLNHIEHEEEEVQFYLFKYGIDQSYTKWDNDGEKDEQATAAQIPVNATTEFVDDTDLNMKFSSQIPTDGPAIVEMVNATKDGFSAEDLDKFEELLLDAEKPLYKGCPDFTKLSAIMLPAGNEMVEKTYQAKKIMRMMGSGYKKIHVCSNNCILYWKDNKELTVCPTCGISRWKVDNKTRKVYENIPAKVMWYFPIIPRLQRLFKLESISEDLRWHATRRITDGVLRHPADSQAWRTIDEKFPEIAEDPRNLRLGISADGVDVNSGTRHHSDTRENDIDVFLEPLVNDLQTLFKKGVETYDAFKKENFNMRAVVLWTINDYPALGTLCGCPYSGFKGCVVCGKETHCVRLSASSKQSYAGHRRYLPYNHPFRKQKKAFNGQQECQLAPIPLTGEQIYNEVQHIENKWGKGKRTNNKTSEQQEDTRGIGGKIQKQKRKTTEEEGSSNQVNEAYWKKFNIWLLKDMCETEIDQRDALLRRLSRKKQYSFFSEYHKTMKTIGIPPEKHVTNENEDGEPLSTGKSSEVSREVFQKAHLQFLKTILPGKRIALLESEHSKYFSKWLREEVKRELEISKDSVSNTVRWISYGPRATIVKYEAYNINGYTFRTKSNDGKVYQEYVDYRFRQIPLFKCDWVNHKAGGVKHDKYLGYTLVDLNSLGHKGDPFILASQARQVFYVKDQLDKRLSIVFNTPSKNYKDTYDKVDEEFSTVIHEHNHNILPRDLGNESQEE
ncbi:putative transposase-associated domain-containing protein [Tanacetum coccineum]